MTTKTGTLYGIGVGPGDPELITLKALKVLQRVPHIFASCSPKNTYSQALSIVRCHLNGAGIEHLPFPMTKDPEVLAAAWERKARRVMEVLATGSDARGISYAVLELAERVRFSDDPIAALQLVETARGWGKDTQTRLRVGRNPTALLCLFNL